MICHATQRTRVHTLLLRLRALEGAQAKNGSGIPLPGAAKDGGGDDPFSAGARGGDRAGVSAARECGVAADAGGAVERADACGVAGRMGGVHAAQCGEAGGRAAERAGDDRGEAAREVSGRPVVHAAAQGLRVG